MMSQISGAFLFLTKMLKSVYLALILLSKAITTAMAECIKRQLPCNYQ